MSAGALRMVHEHPLNQIDPMTIYGEYGGRWNCDNCDTEQACTQLPNHCSTCSYDICNECFHPKNHVRHPHPLLYTKMDSIYPEYNGAWRCDVCGVTKEPMEEPNAYHCYQDHFDMCRHCFQGRQFVIHPHVLVPADTNILYQQYPPGTWKCDICQKTGNELGSPYCWHCSGCEFDCCVRCGGEERLPQHPHPLTLHDALQLHHNTNGTYTCNLCPPDLRTHHAGGGVRERFVWHCGICQGFEACRACVDGVEIVCPPPRPRPPPIETTEEGSQSIEGLPDSQICNICLARPKDALISHQGTGHQFCCMRCALECRSKDNRCPVCRMQIENIVKIYNS